MGFLESRWPPVKVVFESHKSPGKGGKFLLSYDSERHCESQVRFLNGHKSVTAKAAERLMGDRTVWQITVDGLQVQEIQSPTSVDGVTEYRLTVPNSDAARRAKQCLGLPDTRVECSENSVRWLVIVKSTFTEVELDRLAFSDVERAQVSVVMGPRKPRSVPKPDSRIDEESNRAVSEASVPGPTASVDESDKPKKTGAARAFLKRFGF
ncbi:hypothetical protein CSPX01_15560 [Colletotrichum filicis]|nr:hypothetical protein CSPX01_15560 [Colletotrichum filicis]